MDVRIILKLYMKLGRPTKYHKKYCEIALDLLSQGYSKEALAGELGISRQCLYEWIAKYQDFGDTVAIGETRGQYIWETFGMQAAQGKISKFNTSVWMFVMKNRFGWTDKQDVTSHQSLVSTLEIVSYGEHKE